MKNNNQIQQGDCLFRKVDKLPANCKRLDKRTVALGEHTGHHHTFNDGVALMEAPSGSIFAVNETEEVIPLLHQEHGATSFAPGGVFGFGQVREKDWFSEMVRPVRD